jgi:hypothetical protein
MDARTRHAAAGCLFTIIGAALLFLAVAVVVMLLCDAGRAVLRFMGVY